MNDSLKAALLLACHLCNGEINEEEGGFIVRKDDEYRFHKIRNANTGTPVAEALFTADKTEFGDKIIKGEMIKNKAIIDSSFHTHPTNYPPIPSHTDLTRLFKGFPINYIYSPSLSTLVQYTIQKDTKSWRAQKITL